MQLVACRKCGKPVDGERSQHGFFVYDCPHCHHVGTVQTPLLRIDVKKGSALEIDFEEQLVGAGITGYLREYPFHPGRRWRFDFAWPECRVAVELEGGTWSHGRHTTGSGFEADCYKYNAATCNAWAVLRFTGKMIKDGSAIDLTRQLLERRRREA